MFWNIPVLDIGITLANFKELENFPSWNAWLVSKLITGAISSLIYFFSITIDILSSPLALSKFNVFIMFIISFSYTSDQIELLDFFKLQFEKFRKFPDFKQVAFPILTK